MMVGQTSGRVSYIGRGLYLAERFLDELMYWRGVTVR